MCRYRTTSRMIVTKENIYVTKKNSMTKEEIKSHVGDKIRVFYLLPAILSVFRVYKTPEKGRARRNHL